VFCGWGVLVAIFAVFGAPRLQARFGTARTLYVNFLLLAADLAVIAFNTTRPAVVIGSVVVAGIFLGVNNTLVTQSVMMVAPVERPVASATYGFIRFIGGGLAPYAAGRLAERFGDAVPFAVGAVTVVLALVAFATMKGMIDQADDAMAALGQETGIDAAEGIESVAGGETVEGPEKILR
jgi:MFS family permease